MSNKFTFKWSSTIEEINQDDWIEIYGTDVIKSRGFMKANEEAKFKDVEFHYLQVFKYGHIIAIVPCFCYGMDLLNIASSGNAKRWIAWIRNTFPKFLKLRAFVTGSYAATCEHFIEYALSLDKEERREVSELIGSEIKRMSMLTKAKFVFVKGRSGTKFKLCQRYSHQRF